MHIQRIATTLSLVFPLWTLGCSGPEGLSQADDLGSGPLDMAPAPDLETPPSDMRPAFFHVELNHILGTGQSLSVGSSGTPPLSTTQPYANLMFNTGVRAGGTNLTSFVPLIETGVETHNSAMANLITKMAREEVFSGLPKGQNSHEILISAHGVGGTAYVGLKKGTAAYMNGINQVTSAAKIAKDKGQSYLVRAITNVHGESDHVANNTNYEQDMLTWQADYEKDIKAITGQSQGVPMLHTQVSSWTKYGQATSIIPGMQLRASLKNADKLLLVGPKYNVAYVADGVHLSNQGYRHMGEYYAKVYRIAVLEGRKWSPLMPLRIVRKGAEIQVTFAVPTPPLALDTTLVTDPGNYGFEYTDESAMQPTIQSVKVSGPDRVTVTLNKIPSGQKGRLRYAFTGKAGALAGATTGARGNLRDSDATKSQFGFPLFNWCVHFDEAIVVE